MSDATRQPTTPQTVAAFQNVLALAIRDSDVRTSEGKPSRHFRESVGFHARLVARDSLRFHRLNEQEAARLLESVDELLDLATDPTVVAMHFDHEVRRAMRDDPLD